MLPHTGFFLECSLVSLENTFLAKNDGVSEDVHFHSNKSILKSKNFQVNPCNDLSGIKVSLVLHSSLCEKMKTALICNKVK